MKLAELTMKVRFSLNSAEFSGLKTSIFEQQLMDEDSFPHEVRHESPQMQRTL